MNSPSAFLQGNKALTYYVVCMEVPKEPVGLQACVRVHEKTQRCGRQLYSKSADHILQIVQDLLDGYARLQYKDRESRIVFINSFKSYGYREYVVNRYDILEEEEPYHLEVMVRINRCLEQPKKLLRNEAYRYLCAYVHIHRSLDIYGYELPMTLFR